MWTSKGNVAISILVLGSALASCAGKSHMPGTEPDASASLDDSGGSSSSDNSGGSGSSSASVSVEAPTSLDFGDVACGSMLAPRIVEIHNPGANNITFTTTLAPDNMFTVSPSNGTVDAGGMVALAVSASTTASGALGMQASVLTVTTDAPGDSPHTFDLHSSITGPIFKAPAGPLNFGLIVAAAGGAMPITFNNNGNAAGTLGLVFTRNDGNAFSVRYGGLFQPPLTALPIPSGGSVTPYLECTPGAGGYQQYAATLTFTSTPSQCGPLPPAITIYCQRN
jgi:hypothetical protein